MGKRFIAWFKTKVLRRKSREIERLREFVYLDEVSVTSLLASVLGAIPSEITETLSNSTRSEFSGTGEYKGASGGAKAGVKREVTRTSDYQVLRKASIQATFKDLYANVESSLVLKSGPLPELKSIDKRQIRIGSDVAPWMVAGSTLKRGKILELQVELRADAIFRTSTIITNVTNIIGQSPILASEVNTQEMRTAIEVNDFLQELMTGLIPIKCRVLDYEVSTFEGQEYLVHSDLFAELPTDFHANRKPLHLVGVVEEALFWKDIRRVLFSGASVKVLCRVGRDNVQNGWSPVKLVDVLKEVMPEMESAMEEFGPSVLSSLSGSADADRDLSRRREAALIRYGELLVEANGTAMPMQLRERIAEIAHSGSPHMGSVDANRVVFREVSECVSGELSCEYLPDDLIRLRGQAMAEYDLMVDGSLAGRPDTFSDRREGVDDERFIDAEIVAIYW